MNNISVVAMISQKGGTGKTTLTIHLAVAAMLAGQSVVIVDLDPQRSAYKWGRIRGDDPPIVVTSTVTQLPRLLRNAEDQGVTLAILDTPPKLDVSEDDESSRQGEAHHAARAADLALITCKPAIFDLQAIGSTVKLAKIARCPARIVFNDVPSRSTMIYKARRAVEIYETPFALCSIGHRVIFQYSAVDGRTALEFDLHSKASREIDVLYNYMMKALKEVRSESTE